MLRGKKLISLENNHQYLLSSGWKFVTPSNIHAGIFPGLLLCTSRIFFRNFPGKESLQSYYKSITSGNRGLRLVRTCKTKQCSKQCRVVSKVFAIRAYLTLECKWRWQTNGCKQKLIESEVSKRTRTISYKWGGNFSFQQEEKIAKRKKISGVKKGKYLA